MNALERLLSVVISAVAIGCSADIEVSTDNADSTAATTSNDTKMAAPYDSEQGDRKRYSSLVGAIADKEEKARVDARTESDQVRDDLTDTEDLVMKLHLFFSMCDNNGRIYPHLDRGVQLKRELALIGAHGTLRVLSDLERRLSRVANSSEREAVLDEIEADYERIERDAETNWQSLVLRYAERNKSDLSVSYE